MILTSCLILTHTLTKNKLKKKIKQSKEKGNGLNI